MNNVFGYCVLVKNIQKGKSENPFLFVLKSKEEAKKYEKELRFLDSINPIEVYKEKLWKLKQDCHLFFNNINLEEIVDFGKYYKYLFDNKECVLLNKYPIELMEFEY